MSSFLRRLFGSNYTSSEAKIKQQQIPPHTAPPRKHPPMVQRPDGVCPRKKTKGVRSGGREGASSIPDEPGYLTIPAKRHTDHVDDNETGSKKRKVCEDQTLSIPASGNKPGDGLATVRASTKRYRASSIDEDVHFVKRSKPMTSAEISLFRPAVPHAEDGTNEDEPQDVATSPDFDSEVDGVSSDAALVALPVSTPTTGKVEASEPTPWWKGLIHDTFKRTGLKSGDGFSKNKARAYLQVKQQADRNELMNRTASYPSGMLLGVGMWAGSSDVPGKDRAACGGADIIRPPGNKPRHANQTSTTTICTSPDQHPGTETSAGIIKLPPLSERPTTKPGKPLTVPVRKLKANKQGRSASQVKLIGLWTHNVGSPMGPTEWIG